MHMSEMKQRYDRDNQFRALVDTMVAYAVDLQMSPGEMREAAIFAEIMVQTMRPISELFPRRFGEIHGELVRSADARKKEGV